MKVILTVLALAAMAPVTDALGVQEQKKLDEYKMTTYQAILISGSKTGEWGHPWTNAHGDHLRRLVTTGQVAIAGMFTGKGADPLLRSVIILNGTAGDAKGVGEGIPGVGKDASYEILKWMGPEGWFQKTLGFEGDEKLYFGFS